MSPSRKSVLPALLLTLASPASAAAGVDLRTTASQVIGGQAPGDRLGESVAVAGDVGPLGMHFVLLGAPFADPNGRANAGAAYLVNAGSMEPKPLLKDAIRLAGAAAGDQTGT